MNQELPIKPDFIAEITAKSASYFVQHAGHEYVIMSSNDHLSFLFVKHHRAVTKNLGNPLLEKLKEVFPNPGNFYKRLGIVTRKGALSENFIRLVRETADGILRIKKARQ